MAHLFQFQTHGFVRKGCFLRDPPSLAEPTRSPRSTRLACPVRPFPITQTTSLDSNQVASHNVVAAAIKLQDRLLRHFTLRKDVEDFSTQYSAESHSKNHRFMTRRLEAREHSADAPGAKDIGVPAIGSDLSFSWEISVSFHLGDFNLVWSTHPLSHELPEPEAFVLHSER